MNSKQRLDNLNKRIKQKDVGYNLILKVERWIYKEITDNDKMDDITLQEWEAYKQHYLQNSTDKDKTLKKLKEEEDIIRTNGGFMELEFVSDMPEELRVKYGINGI